MRSQDHFNNFAWFRVKKSLPAVAVQHAEGSEGSKPDAKYLHWIRTMSDKALKAQIASIQQTDELKSFRKVSLVYLRC